ncbi:MAG: FAD:protein FMN transferase, partial [Planctomycetes bacterium]|nr:FAD:protein FMN transferase [Planctomycetota bacterium]
MNCFQGLFAGRLAPFAQAARIVRAVLIGVLLSYSSATVSVAAQDLDTSKWTFDSKELYFGVPVSVRFFPKNDELAKEVWTYLEGIDDIFNDYRDDSEIGIINKGLEKSYELSDQLHEAFVRAAELYTMSDGRFDITVGP